MTYPDPNDEASRIARKASGTALRELARLADNAADPVVKEYCWHALESRLRGIKEMLADPELPAWLRDELEDVRRDFLHS